MSFAECTRLITAAARLPAHKLPANSQFCRAALQPIGWPGRNPDLATAYKARIAGALGVASLALPASP